MIKLNFRKHFYAGATLVALMGTNLQAQEKSIAPEINKAFRKPDIADFQGKFEKEGREAYHHFEFPFKTLSSIHRALKPGGRLIVVDYHRIEGKSTDWVMGHVRAGLDVVEKEITSSEFKRIGELKDVLKENYLVEFEMVSEGDRKSDK